MIISRAKTVLSRHAAPAQRLFINNQSIRHFNFASSQYASCFTEIPTPNVEKFKKDAIKYLDEFDSKAWYNDPVRVDFDYIVFFLR